MRSNYSFRSRRVAGNSSSKDGRKRRLKLYLVKNSQSGSSGGPGDDSVMIRSSTCRIISRRRSSISMHKKLRDLHRMVPRNGGGGRGGGGGGDRENEIMDDDLNDLFQRTADYIFKLKRKLDILKDLTTYYGV